MEHIMTEQVNFDEFTETYNAHLKEQTKLFTSNDGYFAQYKIDITKSISANPATILEFGCGIGRNIPFLKKAFPRSNIIGTDISLESLAVAQKTNPEVQFIPTTELSSSNMRFDLIFVASVYHHIPYNQRANVTKLIYESLAKQGQVIIFEHNPYNPVTRKIVSACPYDEGVILLAPRTLKKYVREAGFDLYRQGYCLFFPPWLPKFNTIEPYLKWLPLGGQYWVHATKYGKNI
jgi:SAM-dependent methyltransferase